MAARYTLAVATIFVVLGLAVALSLVLADRAIGHNDGQWCDTLSLLTNKPVPPPAKGAGPEQQTGYELYLDFEHLKQTFRCG
jgi:hypothetical protein